MKLNSTKTIRSINAILSLFRSKGEWSVFAVNGERARLRRIAIGRMDGSHAQILEVLQKVYSDPRSVEMMGSSTRALHAKVADEKSVFITPTNLTAAARDRNIESGLLCATEPWSRRR